MLEIHLVKRAGKRALLRCVRADGSETMAEMVVGAEHDLAHFVVESTLGFRRGFYGMLAGGRNIEDFDVAGATRVVEIPAEAVVTEFIVGLLQAERRGEAFNDFNGELLRSIRGARRPMVEAELAGVSIWRDGGFAIGGDELLRMRTEVEALMSRWGAVEVGEELVLEWK